MTLATGLLAGTFAVAVSLQSVLVLGAFSPTLRGLDAQPALDLTIRISVNLVIVSAMLVLATALRVQERRSILAAALIVLIAAATASLRALLQVAAGIYPADRSRELATEIALGGVALAFSMAFGLLIVHLQRRSRHHERERLHHELVAREALEELQREELRVRRQVADGIHGSLQNRFVLFGSELGDIARHSSPEQSARLHALVAGLDDLRENELRTLSHALYPSDVERGLSSALGSLLARVPPSIQVVAELPGEADGPGDRMPESTTVLIVRIVEEGVSNALRHGLATELRVRVRFDAPRGVVEVELADNGLGLIGAGEPSGLLRLRQRVEAIGGSLTLSDADDIPRSIGAGFGAGPRSGPGAGGSTGGAVLRARVPVGPALTR